MRSEKLRNAIHTAFVVLVFSAAAVIIMAGCKEKEGEKRQAPKAQPDVTIQNGVTVLTMGKSARENARIISRPLKATVYRQQMQAYGTVLHPEPLIDISNNYMAAKASVDKATSALDASRKEYERLKVLNEENRNISLKAVQAARAVMGSDQAELSASGSKLLAIKQNATVQWGSVIAQWVFSSSQELTEITELRDVLIRVTLPSDKFLKAAPETVSIEAAASKNVQARLVSRAPTVESLIQGASYFYMASAYDSGLAPGLNVQILMPSGTGIKGVVIPFPAVIWSQGKAWTYVQTDPDHFSRREVTTLNPLPDGFFVQEAFRPGEKVVIKGAQILLSRELLPSESAGGEEEEGE
jgi:hypothetical protein